MIAVIIAFILAYLVGSFPTSFIMGKALKGIDIRQVGSGNAGATNVLRTVGKIPAVVTLIVDILKGSLVVFVIANLLYPYTEYRPRTLPRAFGFHRDMRAHLAGLPGIPRRQGGCHDDRRCCGAGADRPSLGPSCMGRGLFDDKLRIVIFDSDGRHVPDSFADLPSARL